MNRPLQKGDRVLVTGIDKTGEIISIDYLSPPGSRGQFGVTLYTIRLDNGMTIDRIKADQLEYIDS